MPLLKENGLLFMKINKIAFFLNKENLKQVINYLVRKKKLKSLIVILFAISLWFYFLLPKQLFKNEYSTVIESNDNQLLSAIIANDGQWRFPADKKIPEKFKIAITEFEDSRFYTHPGIDPLSLSRALFQNVKHRSVKSGGSTISMQVIRLSRKSKERTLKEKLIEIVLSLRLELKYSKEQILNLYCSHAPFGGNVVGLEAASWRYFGLDPDNLSWGQIASLAVLPNAPSLIFPGKNDSLLLNKRNFLLKKLHNSNKISLETYEAALIEPLPQKPLPLPQEAFHLLNRAIKDGKRGKRIHTTINKELQQKTQSIINKHIEILSGNKIFNASAIIIDVESGQILTYVGNANSKEIPHSHVDNIVSLRSPGSTLKPILYAAMINDGLITPSSLVADIPTLMVGFNPHNYNKTFEGAVSASKALSRSLNVPSVYLLKQYGINKFNFLLKKAGFSTLNKEATHYGLSIILGGAEIKLEELCNTYASFARTLNNYNNHNSYFESDFRKSKYDKNEIFEEDAKKTKQIPVLSASSIWETFKAMIEVSRPDENLFWYHFSGQHPIAWKTGTSWGSRDAWSVGITPKYVVGIWTGNSSGEGRAGHTGLTASAPIMFEIFDLLPKTVWFKEPESEMTNINICRESGFKASQICKNTISRKLPLSSQRTPPCPYHKTVHLDKSLNFQVNANCESSENIITKSWFVLPAIMEYYYKPNNLNYISLPSFRQDCVSDENEKMFGLIYPTENAKIYLSQDLGGYTQNVVFRAAHRRADASLFWFLDNDFIAQTNKIHNVSLSPKSGKYKLTVVDEKGEKISVNFEILNK